MATRIISFTEKDVTVDDKTFTLDKVLLTKIIDTSSKIVAILRIAFVSKQIILWEGASYKPINEFTEQEIDNRIIELI